MKIWVWPFNWWCRIRELETEVRKLKAENASLESMLRTSALQQTGLTNAYTAALTSLMDTRKDWWYSGAYMRLQNQRAQEAADAEYKRSLEEEVEKATRR